MMLILFLKVFLSAIIVLLPLPVVLSLPITSDNIIPVLFHVMVLWTLSLTAIWSKFRPWIRQSLAAITILYIPILMIGNALYASYLESITVKENIVIYKYAPFVRNTKAVSLEEESIFHFSDIVPRMDGATALYPVYSSFAKATCLDKNEQDRIQCSTTARAYGNLINGTADIIFVAGPSDEQLKYADDAGVEMKFTPIGKEAFVFFVNNKNPISTVSSNDIKAVYSGQITNWRDVGGKNKEIVAYQRPKNSGSQTMLEKIMDNTPLMVAPREKNQDSMFDIIQNVQYRNQRHALGFSFRFFSTEMVDAKNIKLLSIDGIAPTHENIKNNTYPFALEFYAVTRDEENPVITNFLEWILSSQGQYLIEKTGYVPIN